MEKAGIVIGVIVAKIAQYYNKSLVIKEMAVELCEAIESGGDESKLLEVSKKLKIQNLMVPCHHKVFPKKGGCF